MKLSMVLECLSTRERALDDAGSVLQRNAGRLDAAPLTRKVALAHARIPDHDALAHLGEV